MHLQVDLIKKMADEKKISIKQAAAQFDRMHPGNKNDLLQKFIREQVGFHTIELEENEIADHQNILLRQMIQGMSTQSN